MSDKNSENNSDFKIMDTLKQIVSGLYLFAVLTFYQRWLKKRGKLKEKVKVYQSPSGKYVFQWPDGCSPQAFYRFVLLRYVLPASVIIAVVVIGIKKMPKDKKENKTEILTPNFENQLDSLRYEIAQRDSIIRAMKQKVK